MKTIVKLCAAAAACGLLLSGARAAAAEAARISGKDAFEILKGFAGEWTGKVAEGEPVPNPSVIYHVTAAQSAVVETLFPGTAHEMVTVYHMDGDKLVMTHYCAAGNQPHMRLAKKSTRTDLLFEFVSGSNMNPRKDSHMHSAHIHIEGEGRITGEWSGFKDGKPDHEAKFVLTRKGSGA